MHAAVVFPGQGSQFVGMADAWDRDEVGRAALEEASAAIGGDIVRGCHDEAALATTEFVQPAILALQAWSRRAEISCDRAALICTRDLRATVAAMVKMSLGVDAQVNIDEYLAHLPDTRKGIGRFAELLRSHPYLPKRVQALQVFAGSSFYQRLTGADLQGAANAEQADAQVAEILKVF